MKWGMKWALCDLYAAGYLFLDAFWPCFQRMWTLRLKTAHFMADASVPSNTREATGPPMFTCHVRSAHLTLVDWSSAHILAHSTPGTSNVLSLLSSLHIRPPWGGVQGPVGWAALSSEGPRCAFELAGGVPPQPVSDCGAETPLDPALHSEPPSRPGALQEVCHC